MARERRVFSEEFKREAVKLARQPGASKAGIARDLGVGSNVLGRWFKEFGGAPQQAARQDGVSSQELERLRRELAKVKMERDILKKALGYFAAEPK